MPFLVRDAKHCSTNLPWNDMVVSSCILENFQSGPLRLFTVIKYYDLQVISAQYSRSHLTLILAGNSFPAFRVDCNIAR